MGSYVAYMQYVQISTTGSVEGGAVSLLSTLVHGKLVILGLVDLVFLRCWSRWTSAVIWGFGRCFLTIDTDRPGQLAKNQLCMAWSHVDTTGYPGAACRNATRSCAVFVARVLIMKLAIGGTNCGSGTGAGTACTGTVHSMFAVRGPCTTSFSL